MALLYFIWPCVWRFRSLPRQILGLVSGVAFIAFASASISAAEFTDITLRSGVQLKADLANSLQDKDVGAAVRFFTDQKLYPEEQGLTKFEFRSVDSFDRYSLFFIPISSAKDYQNLVLSAQGPKNHKVLLGTIEKGKDGPVVTKERQVVNGEVQVSKNDLLKRIAKCIFTGCAGSAGCVLSGPAWFPCLCLSCGTVIAACGITEIFLP